MGAMMAAAKMVAAKAIGARRRSLEELENGLAGPTGYSLALALFATLGRKLSARDACGCAPERNLPEPLVAGLRWAILQPKSGGLGLLESEAGAMGLVAYAPRERVVLTSVRIGAYVSERALLPGYLFVACPKGLPIDFGKLEAARGGGPALRREGAPVMLRGAIVEALNAAEIGGAFDCVEAGRVAAKAAKASRLKAGQRVMIMDGPFVGFIGAVKRAQVGGRIELLLAGAEVFGRLSVAVADVRAL